MFFFSEEMNGISISFFLLFKYALPVFVTPSNRIYGTDGNFFTICNSSFFVFVKICKKIRCILVHVYRFVLIVLIQLLNDVAFLTVLIILCSIPSSMP